VPEGEGRRDDAGGGATPDPWPACVPAQGPAAPFVKGLGGAGSESAFALGVNSTGNAVVMAGTFEGSVDYGDGPLTSAGAQDIVVTRVDGQGAALWTRRFGGLDWDVAGAVAVEPGGSSYVTGAFGGTVDFGGGPLTASTSGPRASDPTSGRARSESPSIGTGTSSSLEATKAPSTSPVRL
jgi:hypothetical protein